MGSFNDKLNHNVRSGGGFDKGYEKGVFDKGVNGFDKSGKGYFNNKGVFDHNRA